MQSAKRKRADQFLSTPSARRATIRSSKQYFLSVISIHALCEEGDIHMDVSSFFAGRFLSTPSARRATLSEVRPGVFDIFLSTPSARRATAAGPAAGRWAKISIHALCEEGDADTGVGQHRRSISIHALCEEGDRSTESLFRLGKDFYPRPLRGGRLLSAAICA